jgi:hypothetical protein
VQQLLLLLRAHYGLLRFFLRNQSEKRFVSCSASLVLGHQPMRESLEEIDS